MDFEPTKNQISLHGLGFLQVILPGKQRIHVWHPDLPKRKCFEHSSIHSHRFSFVSRVLVGVQINQRYRLDTCVEEAYSHVAYQHNGERKESGNRPWDHCARVEITPAGVPEHFYPGNEYLMEAHDFHATESNGIVVTLMRKTFESPHPAHSLCKIGVEPDVNFDRMQMTSSDMWDIFNDAIKGAA